MAPAIKAVVAGVSGSYLIGGKQKVSLLGMVISPAVLICSSVGAVSIVSSLSHDFVLEKIKGNSYSELETKVLSPALTAAASVAVCFATLGSLDGLAIYINV